MQGVKIRNDLFPPGHFKCYAVNNFALNGHQKNFMNSVQNVRHTLGCLERSIRKSNEYEQKLLHCKSSHRHSHGDGVDDNWWESETDGKCFKCSNTTTTTSRTNTKSSEGQDESTNIWSSMSIICLQIQYEKLAKRYRTLMQAYNEQCYAVGTRDKRLQQWRERVHSTQERLTHAHNALLTVGEKYLALQGKRKVQKKWYKDQLLGMKRSLQAMMDGTTRARVQFDTWLEACMTKENDSDVALLLYEIRKCNLLSLENMQLKALIEQLIPGQMEWKP